MDFPVFDVQVPRNENTSHRLNTTLLAMVEIAVDHLLELQTMKNRGKKKHLTCQHNIGIMSADYHENL